jgi:hypothetical protein
MWWTDDPNEYPFSYDVFQSCNGLTSFYVDTNNPNYSSHNGVLFNKDLTKLICYPLAKSDTSYSIPDETVSIGDGAFADGEEENQDEDNNIIAKMIKASSSTGSSMKSISIPISVRTIGTKAFANRKSLTAVYVNWKTPPVITEFDSIFKNIYLRDVKLHIPMGTLSTYLDAPVWQDFNLIESENVAIEQRMEINILNVYPNPTSGVVYIDGIDAVVEVSVFSANGTLVKRTHGNHVDLSTQPAGAYLLRVGNKTARVVKK